MGDIKPGQRVLPVRLSETVCTATGYSDHKIILDTKWKRLVDKPRINYGISQADMYQMYAYAKKYRTSEIWLLYPVNPEMRDHTDIAFRSDDGVDVRIFFVDVANIEDSLRDLRSRIV